MANGTQYMTTDKARIALNAISANLVTKANAIAYYTDTTGTFGTKNSANGALYATSANGTLQWGTLPTAQGGTGNTSFTANRLMWTETATKMVASYHYVNASKIGINSTSEPGQNLYVNGSFKIGKVQQAITGSGTAAKSAVVDGVTNYYPALWTFNLSIATPADGDMLTIKIPCAGHGQGVFISTDNGITYYPVSVGTGADRLTTHYANGNIITLFFNSNGATNQVFPVTGDTVRHDITNGCWRIMNYYDNAPYGIRVYRQTSGYNADYPLLVSRTVASSIGTSDSNGSSTNNIYGIIWNDTTKIPTLNPSTGEIKAVKFTGSFSGNVTGNVTGNADSATEITRYKVTSNDNNNATGYFLVYTWTLGAWTNFRMSFIVTSRHTGGGLIDIAVGINSATVNIDNTYAQIKYWGVSGSGSVIATDSWQIYINADATKAYLFAKYNDYNEALITPLTNTRPEKSTWVTSIDTATYGTKKAETQINRADSTTQLVTSRSILIDLASTSSASFNGTADITPGVKNTLKVTNGGTGTNTAPTQWGIIYASSTSAYASTGAGTAGYLLQSNASSAPSWIQATNANIVSTIVKRDASGNFSAGTITATLSGNATTAGRIVSRDAVTCETGVDKPAVSGLSMSEVYNNGYPTAYGNVMTMYGGGAGQLLLGWSSSSTAETGVRANAYIRSQRDNANMKWSDWYTILDSGNYNSYAPTLTGTGASGTWGISITGSSASCTGNSATSSALAYPAQLTATDDINGFNEASRFKVTTWTSNTTPGVGNGILISAGWTSASYGAQIAIDDDPTWYIALRQRNGDGWKAWKRIPMGDGTGASGTWDISISGIAAEATTASYLSAPNTAGCITDVYGNFKHQRTTNTDSWGLLNNSGTAKFSFYWETGNATVAGTVTAAGFSGPLTGNVTGNCSGSSASCTGNAATATTASSCSGNAATATSAGLLNIDNRAPIKGNNQLEFQQFSGTGNTGWNNSNPTNDWYHHLRFNHANDSGYFVDLAFCFHAENNYVRRVVGGVDKGWKRLWTEGNSVTNAVWNDLAECRKSEVRIPGYAITQAGKYTTKRLEPGCRITSDTWGFALGNEEDKNKMPVAISGRVLAYPYRPREEYHLGDCVCSAPDGKVDIMTRQEIRDWPDCIIGIVNEIPDYEEWGSDEEDNTGRKKIKVNGRIWIDVK